MLLYTNSELVYFRVGLAGFKLWQLQIVAILAILRSCFACALLHCALCIAIIKILRGLRRKIRIVFWFLRELHFPRLSQFKILSTLEKQIRYPHENSYRFFSVFLCASVSPWFSFCSSVYSVPLC